MSQKDASTNYNYDRMLEQKLQQKKSARKRTALICAALAACVLALLAAHFLRKKPVSAESPAVDPEPIPASSSPAAANGLGVREYPSLQDAAVGDTVLMGHYEQDGVKDNGAEPIEWRVLAIQDGEALLLSEKILAYVNYNEDHDGYLKEWASESDYDWEHSYLRNWLNTDFYSEAFSEAEREQIVLTEYASEKKAFNGNERDARTTSEKITLLSDKEVPQYLGEGKDAKASGTKAANQTAEYSNFKDTWFLRSPYSSATGAALRYTYRVNANGEVTWDGAQEVGYGIRPAMWVSIAE